MEKHLMHADLAITAVNKIHIVPSQVVPVVKKITSVGDIRI